MSTNALFLLVRLGEHIFAIEAEPIVEVISLVRLKVVPRAPAASAGIMSYRGEAVPVVDLNIIAAGVPTPARLMTRIVIVRVDGTAHEQAPLGLLVPEVLRTAHLDPQLFVSTPLAADGAGHLGGVAITDEGPIQRIRLSALLGNGTESSATSPAAA